MKKQKSTYRLSGFTLMELMVSMSLIAVVIVLGGYIYQIFHRYQVRYTDTIYRTYDGATLQAMMQRDVWEAYDFEFTDERLVLIGRNLKPIYQYSLTDSLLIRERLEGFDSLTFTGLWRFPLGLHGFQLVDTSLEVRYTFPFYLEVVQKNTISTDTMKGLNINQISKGSFADSTSLVISKESIWDKDLRLGKLIDDSEKQKLYHLLAILLGSGLGIMDAMEVVIDQSEKKGIKEILIRIQEALIEGKSLSESLEQESIHFTTFERHSLQMGEQTGQMANILSNLASFYEKRIRLKRKVVQALSYPIAVILIAMLVLTFMILFVVPMFQDIFNRFDAELPPITQFILDVSDFVQTKGIFILLGISVLILGFVLIRERPDFRRFMTSVLLRIPVLGKLILRLQLSRFCYTFSMLLLARVNMDKSLQLLDKIITFYPIQHALGIIRQEVIEGSTLYEAIVQHSIFPKYITQIVKVGEKTAKLDQMLENLAKSLEEESEAGISQLTQFLEPVLIILLGGMVAIILVSMYLPMFELSSAIG